ncbi:MAG: zf-HC2 domain-containing protein, partial [Clostridia bacterium]|nr:zf-HC2 domain-containing protein [Clostridia bacterium]
MDCREFSNLLEDYLGGMLPDEDASRLKAHAEKCAECAALLALRMDCRKMDEDVEVPDEFSSAWRQMIREETKMEKQ